jgi:hypothetical protein
MTAVVGYVRASTDRQDLSRPRRTRRDSEARLAYPEAPLLADVALVLAVLVIDLATTRSSTQPREPRATCPAPLACVGARRDALDARHVRHATARRKYVQIAFSDVKTRSGAGRLGPTPFGLPRGHARAPAYWVR